ncbi:hypothetical protein NDU88_001487 [Pleurodeles waltl]|uniref:Uncharacterized protein n=1 Tax=Pleurodeles waltl TaxID=8319 RepID=A0AAV7SD26_PLEWA|nr:hypothetical protein NDU88_001487 [Pleurodeles waltl]
MGPVGQIPCNATALSPPSYYDALKDGLEDASFLVRTNGFLDMQYHQVSESQESTTLKRRGGLVDQRDIILAHQAHKIQSTPQAKRKEWE